MIELYQQAEQEFSLYQNEDSERLDYWEFRNLLYFLKAQFTYHFEEYLYDEQCGYVFHTDEHTLKNAILAYLYDNVELLDVELKQP